MSDHPPASPAPVGAHANIGRAICPICYEDLKPVVEDLQSISVCGHVFHELCLQQWQEYCPAGKKCTCPVCKQSYIPRDVTRLFFQSTGGSGHNCPSFCTQKTLSEAEAETLSSEIKKLQGKLSAVGSALDAQKQHVGELNSEILVWKSRAKREEEMKTEHQKEKEIIRHLLQIKEADLRKTSEECLRVKEKSLALAKELAALKLAMDVNLGEEEVAKLITIGQGTHNDAIDVLQRSLLLRNKCYKELMIQCNLLGRAETRSLKKLEKSEEKIKMLKIRLQELEKAVEKKDSEILRVMKVSKEKIAEQADLESSKQNSNYPYLDGYFYSSEVEPDDSVTESFLYPPPLPTSLIGTENGRKHAKWCRNVTKVNPSMETPKRCGELIALGADGRGGTIKVLRALNKFRDRRARTLVTKKCKHGRVQAIQAQEGCLGIEKYFGKTGS
ncbi:unnamed protein product [Spirodela intermedia]|uniref:RING-type domain-containing protein n=1 Tax=Spirodela intermedia TaxID=51605 RepID=A0A7I8K6I1_SPIIN|nr:unnamed protein product [Spirodela intermedia]